MKFEGVLPAMRAGKIALGSGGMRWRRNGKVLEGNNGTGNIWLQCAPTSTQLLDEDWNIVEERKPLTVDDTIGYIQVKEVVEAQQLSFMGEISTTSMYRIRIDELPAQKDQEQAPSKIAGSDALVPPAGGGLEGAGTNSGCGWFTSQV